MKVLTALVALVALSAAVWWGIAQTNKTQLAADGLSYALALARYEPLLALAGTDPGLLRTAAADLEAARSELAALQNNEENARLIHEGLYPTRFLHTLAVLEEARQEFLRTGAAPEALHYDEALEAALEALREDTNVFKESFARAVPTTTAPYQVLGGTVSRTSLLAAIRGLEQRAREFSEEHARRKQCIYKNITGCNMPDPSALIPQALIASEAYTEVPMLVEEVRSIRAELLEDEGLLRAPVIALEKSACVPNLPSPHYFLAREESTGPLAPPIEFLGDILLQPIPPSPQGPVLEYLTERGARYYPPSPVAFYQCPGIGSDLGRIFAALSIYRELGASSAVISESVALRLLRDTIEKEGGERHAELALAVKNRSARFDTLVKEIAAFGKNDAAIKRAGIPADVSALYLFYVKSGFPSLYLGHNASATGESGISIYESNDAAALRERLVLWSEIRETVSRDELLGHMRVFFTMHDDPQESVRAGEK